MICWSGVGPPGWKDLNMKFTVHAVLAGAYRGKRTNLKAMLTHASLGGDSAVCGRVAEGSLCDLEEVGPPTCKSCLAAWNQGQA
jgi:hypothetical protein